MKKPKRTTLALYGLCAVIWTFRIILSIVYQEYNYAFGFFVLNILTALLWIAAFIKWTLKYRSDKDKSR